MYIHTSVWHVDPNTIDLMHSEFLKYFKKQSSFVIFYWYWWTYDNTKCVCNNFIFKGEKNYFYIATFKNKNEQFYFYWMQQKY